MSTTKAKPKKKHPYVNHKKGQSPLRKRRGPPKSQGTTINGAEIDDVVTAWACEKGHTWECQEKNKDQSKWGFRLFFDLGEDQQKTSKPLCPICLVKFMEESFPAGFMTKLDRPKRKVS